VPAEGWHEHGISAAQHHELASVAIFSKNSSSAGRFDFMPGRQYKYDD
jgi:hypothetical protein